MCYNATVSATTFLATAAVCLVLWWRNRAYDRPIALILFFISLMQAVEWGLWLNLECNTVNKLLTAFIPILLYAQPLFLNAVVGYYNAGWGAGYGLIAFVFFVALCIKAVHVAMNYGLCVTVHPNGHLEWNPTTTTVPFSNFELYTYMAAMIYPLITLKNTLFGLLYTALSALSYTALKSSPGNATTWPSVWCHFVNVLAVVALAT
jgi:hypothetical protein